MTRPQEAGERFVARLPPDLRARLTPVYSPLIRIEPMVGAVDLGDARGLIFTSSNGVSVAARLTSRRDLPCYCVGERTARAAQGAGWQAECSGANAESLIATLHRTRPDGPLLHLRGKHGRGNVAARLSALNCPTHAQVIYDQPLLPLSDAAHRILAGPAPVIVPLFSPRTARQFADLVTGAAPLYLAALSRAVADQVNHLKYNELATAPYPTSAALAQLVGQLADAVGRVERARPPQ
jgi:uroporphyrinogen-III synthase